MDTRFHFVYSMFCGCFKKKKKSEFKSKKECTCGFIEHYLCLCVWGWRIMKMAEGGKCSECSRECSFCLSRFNERRVSSLFFLIMKTLHTVMFINSQSLAYRKTHLSPLLSVSSSMRRSSFNKIFSFSVFKWGDGGAYIIHHNPVIQLF